MIDLQDPTLQARLLERTPERRYVISDIELILNMRHYDAIRNMAAVQLLADTLLRRCAPHFQQRTQGLSQRPHLREEAIANMQEHLLREALNPKETFMTQNFIHYLRCLCTDEFNKILRQEGLSQRRDADGQPVGRPQHVPRSKMESITAPTADDENPLAADVADPQDQYEQLHATDEAQRILDYLTDPLDRRIVVLRSLEHWKWDDIAEVCQKTERTIRTRYKNACVLLRKQLLNEQEFTQPQF